MGLRAMTDVEIGSYDVAIEIIGRDAEKWHPHTRETADHSFPYCVAVALLDGKVTLHSFDVTRLTDPAVVGVMQKVRVVQQHGVRRPLSARNAHAHHRADERGERVCQTGGLILSATPRTGCPTTKSKT